MSIVQATGRYISSFFGDELIALGGDTGRLSNSMIGPLGLKIFNEFRLGIILWTYIGINMACKQYTLRGTEFDGPHPILPSLVYQPRCLQRGMGKDIVHFHTLIPLACYARRNGCNDG